MFAHKKIHGAIVISALLSLCSAGQIFAMQVQLGKLLFVLDAERRVQSCQALDGMKFYKEKAAEEFLDKDIMTVIPLSDSAFEKLGVAFGAVSEMKEEVNVDYALEKDNFRARIMPVTGPKSTGFVVLVRKLLAAPRADFESPAVKSIRKKISSSSEAAKADEWDESSGNEDLWAPKPWNERQQEG